MVKLKKCRQTGRRYLLSGGAKAAYMVEEGGKGLLIFGTNPTRQEIVEEVLHHEQHLKYGRDYFVENRNLMEVEAQNILLKIGKDEKWSKEAMEEIQAAKTYWTKMLEDEK
jgi:hypothetical protein